MRSIEIRDGGDATVRQTKTRGSVRVCAVTPRTSTFVSPSTIETRSSRRTDRIARTNRTRARRTERPTETIQIKDTVIVTRH